MTLELWPLLVAAIALQLGDWASTWAVLRSGRGREANPVVLWVMNKIGTYTALALLKIGSIVMLVLFCYALGPLGLLLSCFALLYVVLHNRRIMRKIGATFP